jgi:predicted RNA-binding Zn-ribbon protein involved in translation (DUF1610 family)
MIETICQSCGNIKSFEESYIGKTFKCPSCSNPVIIQNVGSQLNTEPVSQTNSFADEIARAEAEKTRDQENQLKAAQEKVLKDKKNARIILPISVIAMIFMFWQGGLPSNKSLFNMFFWIVFTILTIYFSISSFRKLLKK